MEFKVFDLGLIEFEQAWHFQKALLSQVKEGTLTSALILCQHYPVITLGRLSDKRNILAPQDELKAKGVEIFQIERGGDVTYHGPGQLIAYPIFNLQLLKKDIHLFLRQLEEVIIDLLSDFGVMGLRQPGLTGVWVNKNKIASIGIAIKNWINFHGLSINIKKDDLSGFRMIKPCGMDIEMTSLEIEIGRDIGIETIKENLITKFKDIFKYIPVPCTPYSLHL